MARRTLYRNEDLRRWARVCREEGVTVRVAPDGALTMSAGALGGKVPDGSDDLDDRLARFAAS